MDHTYKKIRSVVLDILRGKESVYYDVNERGSYEYLSIGVSDVFERYENPKQDSPHLTISPAENKLSDNDKEVLIEVFWDLFREGVITLGKDRNNIGFPYFRIPRYSPFKKII